MVGPALSRVPQEATKWDAQLVAVWSGFFDYMADAASYVTLFLEVTSIASDCFGLHRIASDRYVTSFVEVTAAERSCSLALLASDGSLCFS